jgi:predicted adenylyl cyclase CyaB
VGRNVEIKARIEGRWAEIEKRAAAIADSGPTILEQEDIFYSVPRGRLKLRTENGRSELIYYLRSDQNGPKESDYVCLPVADAATTKRLLAAVHGERGIVRKQRVLYLAGQTRIHLDRVEGLGDFLELEVVLGLDETVDDGAAIARDIMGKLGIDQHQLVMCAYMDLLNEPKECSGREAVS